MPMAAPHDIQQGDPTILRLGGVLGLLGSAIHVVVNFVLYEAPPAGIASDAAQLEAYIADSTGNMAIANGLRNLAVICVAFLAVGAYRLTAAAGAFATNAWGLIGLLGAAGLMGGLSLAHATEAVIFVNTAGLPERPEIFLLLRSLYRVFFRAAEVFLPVMIVGFSVAGLRTGSIPRWHGFLGLTAAALGLLVAFGMAWVLTGGWAAQLQSVTQPISMVWYLALSVLMIRRAST